MRVRCFVFLLFFLASATRLYSQGPDLITLVNNPFAETVRPVLELESGYVVVKLTNGFRETVSLTELALSQEEFRSGNLLKTQVDFSPGEIRYFNLDSKRIDLRQDVRLILEMSPRPPKQRPEFLFRFESGTSRFVEAPAGPKPPIWRR